MKLNCIKNIIFLLCISNLSWGQQKAADSAKQRRPDIFKNTSFQAGLMVSMDAEGLYGGPSFWLSAGYRLRPKIKLQLFGHYFADPVNEPTIAGRLRLLSVGLLPQFHLGRKAGRGMYAGIGICRQYREESSQDDFSNSYQKRVNTMPAYTLGCQFPVNGKRQSLALELFATGPYNETFSFGSYTEVFTQLSLGAKFNF